MMHRREFIRTATAAALIGSMAERFGFGAAPQTGPGGIPRRVLGRTGEHVSMLGIGGFHLDQGGISEPEATQVVRTALDSGVNFLDNSWDYNGGESEKRMGNALRDGYRGKAFLMTKLDGRTAQSATQQLDQSLQRLRTDHVDLIQIHEVIRMDDPARVFAPGGAVEGLVKAREAGKVRYIGFTGHKSPEIHLHMLAVADRHGFRFDTVQMPLNVMDAHFDSFIHKVLPVAKAKDMGVLGMKSMGDKIILKSGVVTAVECLHFAMSLPVSVCITGCDSMKILQQALGVARHFTPYTRAEMAEVLAKTEPVASAGKYELYKTSSHFDSTAANPQWLG
jgi:predicted aldo/keto reductase-like oxidoreductase